MGPSLRLVFITDGEPFHGASPEERALGGSETALVQAARALARRGHAVQVFCRCPLPGLYAGVTYRDRQDLVRACGEERFDVAIISRFTAALDLPLQAGLRVLWNHDLLVQPQPLAQRLEQLDLCLVLSQFHAADFRSSLPACAGKLRLTRNGLDLELLERASRGVERVPGRLIYVSRPERGLKLLLSDIWPSLRREMPWLSLDICGYSLLDTPAPQAWRQEIAQVQELAAQAPGLRLLGGLAKEEYYRHLASCECLLYPCTFPEISCLAVLEAQALGVAVLTSDSYALRESVAVAGFRVPGRPGSAEYLAAFLERARQMLGHALPTRGLAQQAQAAVRAHYGWNQVVAEWEQLFLEELGGRMLAQPEALAAGLLVQGDRAWAEDLLARPLEPPEEGPPPADPQEPALLAQLAAWLAPELAQGGAQPLLEVVSPDQGRTAAGLAGLLPGARVQACQPFAEGSSLCDGLLLRDSLERSPDPGALLAWALARLKPQGWLMICVASGAWPLHSPGHLARRYDLGQEEMAALLPGRPLRAVFLPRGLVRQGARAYHLGRWVFMCPAAGPPPGRLEALAGLRRTPPAPPELLREVQRAGLL